MDVCTYIYYKKVCVGCYDLLWYSLFTLAIMMETCIDVCIRITRTYVCVQNLCVCVYACIRIYGIHGCMHACAHMFKYIQEMFVCKSKWARKPRSAKLIFFSVQAHSNLSEKKSNNLCTQLLHSRHKQTHVYMIKSTMKLPFFCKQMSATGIYMLYVGPWTRGLIRVCVCTCACVYIRMSAYM